MSAAIKENNKVDLKKGNTTILQNYQIQNDNSNDDDIIYGKENENINNGSRFNKGNETMSNGYHVKTTEREELEHVASSTSDAQVLKYNGATIKVSYCGTSNTGKLETAANTSQEIDISTHDGFRVAAHDIIEYIINYQKDIRSYNVTPNVEPGFMHALIPHSAPEKAEPWQNVLSDLDRVIMPGMAHWMSPQFHAYYPSGSSNASILADVLSNAIGCVGISWTSAPSCTELEVHMMDWLGKLLRLPEVFLFESGLGGGGVIQGSACETTLITMLAARTRKIGQCKKDENCENTIQSKLVAFVSEQAHSSVARAGLLANLRVRPIPTHKDCSMDTEKLVFAIQDEIDNGFVPFYLLATLGTTASCAFDNLQEVGPVCREYDIWLHIDAAYAGAAFICKEFRPLLDGVEYAMSFNLNPHKFLLCTLDCSALWLKDSKCLTDVFKVDALFLETPSYKMPNFRHWAIQLSRRFRALKLWFVMRLYGAEGLRNHIYKHVNLAKYFKYLVESDERFEVCGPVILGLVCFRLKHETRKHRVEGCLVRLERNTEAHIKNNAPKTNKETLEQCEKCQSRNAFVS